MEYYKDKAMKLRTEIAVPKSTELIQHKDRILLIGSCFANRIGHKLEKRLWKSINNPLGISYNPISIFDQLKTFAEGSFLNSRPWFEYGGIWSHYDLHSSNSNINEELAVSRLNKQISDVHLHLKNCHWTIITLGTAWVYKLKEDNGWVNNCHKRPSNLFEKNLLSIEEIYDEGVKACKNILELKPEMKFIFTVSPVRHIKNGLIDNNRSKSILISAVHQLVQDFPQAYYFPSFEIMMDDLRDYRFYEKDMIHPSEVAVEYIWKKFQEAFISLNAQELSTKIIKLKNQLAHKPFFPNSEIHQTEMLECKRKIKEIENNYGLDFGL